ncbi:hypothetical protein CRENBAI_021538 [Crenichthys baileyi]|uniref:Uncharacterized protein n=1 Tax=Crenichthys baileyi TaxID=28760 RepID=A0AAV9R3L0_9TELE
MGVLSTRIEELEEEMTQNIKDHMFCVCKLIVLVSPQLRSHLFQHSLPASFRKAGRYAPSSLYYLETDSLPFQPIRGCEKQPPVPPLVPCSLEFIPLSMPCHCVVWHCESQLYCPLFFCSELFSLVDPLHTFNSMNTHTD